MCPWLLSGTSALAQTTSLSVNRFPNQLAPNLRNNFLRNPPFYSLVLFLIIFLTHFINKPASSRDYNIFMIFILSIKLLMLSYQIIIIFFFFESCTVTDPDAVNSNGTKKISANDLSTFFIRSKPVFRNGPKLLSKNPPDCPIFWNRFFDYFILADELFA